MTQFSLKNLSTLRHRNRRNDRVGRGVDRNKKLFIMLTVSSFLTTILLTRAGFPRDVESVHTFSNISALSTIEGGAYGAASTSSMQRIEKAAQDNADDANIGFKHEASKNYSTNRISRNANEKISNSPPRSNDSNQDDNDAKQDAISKEAGKNPSSLKKTTPVTPQNRMQFQQRVARIPVCSRANYQPFKTTKMMQQNGS